MSNLQETTDLNNIKWGKCTLDGYKDEKHNLCFIYKGEAFLCTRTHENKHQAFSIIATEFDKSKIEAPNTPKEFPLVKKDITYIKEKCGDIRFQSFSALSKFVKNSDTAIETIALEAKRPQNANELLDYVLEYAQKAFNENSYNPHIVLHEIDNQSYQNIYTYPADHIIPLYMLEESNGDEINSTHFIGINKDNGKLNIVNIEDVNYVDWKDIDGQKYQISPTEVESSKSLANLEEIKLMQDISNKPETLQKLTNKFKSIKESFNKHQDNIQRKLEDISKKERAEKAKNANVNKPKSRARR